MKIKFYSFSLFALIAISFLISCSQDDSILAMEGQSDASTSIDKKTLKGRFDDSDFKWDYSFSTDSTDRESNELVIGALYPIKEIHPTVVTKAETTRRSNGAVDGSRRRSAEIVNPIDVTEILIDNANFLYVGAAFPQSEFANTFSKEITYPRNPIEISTNFQDPYLGEITKETGSFGYKKFMKEVLRSPEYKDHVSSGVLESLDFQCSEFYSYSDIEKAFSSNIGLAKLFSAKVQRNSRKTNIKSRLMGQLISKNFSVTMETPVKGFFKEKIMDQAAENPVFIRSMSYGKLALLAIESEYSFEEVKKAVEAGIKWKISGSGSYSQRDTEILQRSTITVYVVTDDKSIANQNLNSFEGILKAFKVSYSEKSMGFPVTCMGQYTKDLSIFKVQTGSRRDSRRQ
ncbi:thiol-activated cytolysin family protein [Bacteroides heparinolyticus]|uniref:thiol-activated cytolysin family protein n=2 Tax=Prevotella heparinolytica TaxID=28113 RepID=UPI0023F4A0A1|nr:thiol-activated cytolysin family protein [Bacteroides heparinolyticus]